MQGLSRLYRIPLVFFALAACFGLLLRWHFVSPMNWLDYPYWLHAHSHLMFLGWVTNFLLVFMMEGFVPAEKLSWYRKAFLSLQLLLGGMAVTFPLQGYGVASIVLSTLHTALVVVFALRFFRDTRRLREPASLWYVRIALIYFLVSAIGPVAIGATGAMGLAQTRWYYLSVYYYLHFQYNGFFTFGAFATLLRVLEMRQISFDVEAVRRAGRYLAVACVPAYLLSTLWIEPGLAFNALGFLAAAMQITSLVLLVKGIGPAVGEIALKLQPAAVRLMAIGMVSYSIKVVAQLLSAFPGVAHLAALNRPYVMAYLHLVLIGTVTLPILAWYLERGMFNRIAHTAIVILVTGFLLTEALLMLMPSLTHLTGALAIPLFIASVILTVGVILMPFSHRNPDKSYGSL